MFRRGSRQIKIYAFTLVVALCGIVFGLMVVVAVFLMFGHGTAGFFNDIHVPFGVFLIGTVVVGFAWGWIVGYKEATKRFPN